MSRAKLCAAVSTVVVVGFTLLWGAPPVGAVEPPQIDVGATPPDGPPGPDQPMRQGAFCTKVGTLPGTDYRVQPHYLDMLDLAEAWRFGRGAGQKVAVIDTGVSPHPRLPDLVGGGDYVVAGVVVPNRFYTPTFRKVVEWVEYVCLTGIFPLSFWLMGVLAAIRYR